MNGKVGKSQCKPSFSNIIGLMPHNYALKLCAYITCTVSLSLIPVIYAKDVQSDDLPYFADQLNNITVPVGRDATFTCIVHNLKKEYKVVWFHKDRHILLAINDVVIYRSGRLSVSTHAANTFNLQIRDIREEDSGEYMCQINTNPMMSQSGFLQIVVPPHFVHKLTSSDEEVREDSSVSLRCSANGSPEPQIKWRREDEQPIDLYSSNGTMKSHKETVINGEFLNITKVTRLHMGAYICIAKNGIPPAVSKRIFLGIKFPPLIWPPNQLIGVSVGSSVVLECNLESHPQSLTSWIRHSDRTIIHSNAKYNTYVETTNSHYRSAMRLKINDINPTDFGTFICMAKNILGEVEASIKLFEIPMSETNTELQAIAVKESKTKKKIHLKGKNSNGLEDNKRDFDTNANNRVIALTELLNNEMTSEQITLENEERVTLKTDSESTDTSKAFTIQIIPTLVFVVFYSIFSCSPELLSPDSPEIGRSCGIRGFYCEYDYQCCSHVCYIDRCSF
ncbi:lachesin-like [Oppia nitens]|uniref:lachesin-like n=1 Tax=Oppia nitens TaxID=1686743 RepID=UPI0023DA03D7|nr:lachesin-like [Oppia nitens]